MARFMPMPAVSAASGEAQLQDWLVGPGQPFAAGQAIVVVETEKAIVDIEADADGILLQTLASPGAVVAVGEPIAVLGEPGESVSAAATLLATLARATAPAAVVTPPVAPPTPPVAPHRLFSSPLARRMAREAGLPIEELRGSGPDGRIVRRDVVAALARRQEADRATAEPPAASPGYVDVPHTRMRQAIATRLSRSKSTIPHFYLRGTCQVDRLLALRAELNATGDTRISVNDLVLKAAARAHELVPEMNVRWTDEAVRTLDSVDIAVAVATDGGLLTPVVPGVERMTVTRLAQTTRELAERAKSGRLHQHELEGGAMTVTNLGMFGTEEFAAIINPPQSAILAVGATTKAPVIVDDRVAVGTILRVTLSVDHRPIDGVVAARWMRAFTGLVENPLRILA